MSVGTSNSKCFQLEKKLHNNNIFLHAKDKGEHESRQKVTAKGKSMDCKFFFLQSLQSLGCFVKGGRSDLPLRNDFM